MSTTPHMSILFSQSRTPFLRLVLHCLNLKSLVELTDGAYLA